MTQLLADIHKCPSCGKMTIKVTSLPECIILQCTACLWMQNVIT